MLNNAPELEQKHAQDNSLEAGFINYIINQCKQDKGFAANLKRANNPATEFQCWEVLARFNVDLEKDYQRLPFATLCAAVATIKPETNGNLPLGLAIARCYDEDKTNQNDISAPAQARLRRLLSCETTAEACGILRSLFSLIESKAEHHLDYIHLLKQLKNFHFTPQRIKAKWAQEFYNNYQKEESKYTN